jgi:hypothetical protein
MRPAGSDNIIRISQNGSNQAHRYYKLTLPREIADALPDDLLFTCELTDDGILYRPVTIGSLSDLDLPDWARRP